MNATRKVSLVNFIRAITLATALLLPGVPAIAADGSYGEHAGSVIVPEGLSEGDVKRAIILTLAGRQWGIKSREDGAVVGYLKHRSNEATVTLTYDTESVEIYCVGWAINKKTGERRKPEQPRGWLKNIQGDLTTNLGRAIAGL